MRKLYALLTLMLFAGTAWAQTAITSLSQLSNSKVYYLKSGRTTASKDHYLVYNTTYSNGYLSSTYGSGHATTFDQNQIDNQFLFAIYKVGEKYFMYNLAAGKFVGNATSNNTAIPMVSIPTSNISFKATGNDTYPWMISTNNWTGAVNAARTSGCHGIVNWTDGANNKTDGGNILQICEAGDLSTDTQTAIRTAFITLISNEITNASDTRVGAMTTTGVDNLNTLKAAYDANPSDETLSSLYTAYAACSRVTLAAGEKFKVKCIEDSRGYLAYSANTTGAGNTVPTLAGASHGNFAFPGINDEGVSTEWVIMENSGRKYIYNAQNRMYLATGTNDVIVFANEGTYVTINQLDGTIHGIYFEGSTSKKLSFSPGYNLTACVRKYDGSDNGTKFYIEKTGEIDDYVTVMENKATLRSLLATVNTYTIGTNVGQYNNSAQTAKAVRDNAQDVLNNTNATLAEVQAAITALGGITLNLPQAGKLYRFQGRVSNKYMCPSNATGQMAMEAKRAGADTHEKRASIFMLVEGDDVDGDGTKDYKFLNYEHGYYIQETREMGATNANANSIKIAVNDTKDYYTMKSNTTTEGYGTWLYDNGSQSTPVVDRNGTYKANNCDWTIEEVTYLPVKVSATYRYGTFTSPVKLIQDTDRLKFYTGVMRNGYLELTQYTKSIIPANVPFFIEYVAGSQQSEGSSFLQITTADATAPDENSYDLKGQIETITTPTNQGTIYTLQPAWVETGDHNSATQVAFRQFNGSEIRGCTAYLPISNGTRVAGMRFVSDEATVIEGITDDQQHEVEVFDLSGRRVQQAKKGLYIINGKKVIIR